METFFKSHRATLEAALQAGRAREYWSCYPEIPSRRNYGEDVAERADAAFEDLLGKPFRIDEAEAAERVGGEVSPYGRALGITYASRSPAALIVAAQRAAQGWAAASMQARAGVALEMLLRLNQASFLIGHAVEHTTGQAFAMAFQAGGPHAQDRGLEAVAIAYEAMSRTPEHALWQKPAGKAGILRIDKEFRIVPRGIGLVIACATFPTWNSYPALFADLVTGNAVIVKPHPDVILPLALTVRIGRAVLREAGFDPDILQLAPDSRTAPIAQTLATDPMVGLVDFTGSSVFGGWLREHVRQALLFTEEAGLNPVVIDSTDRFEAMCGNIAFSLSLYSGQMCTAPQNIFVPVGGISTDLGHRSAEEVGAGIASAVDALLSDPDRAASVLGAIQNEATLQRIDAARSLGRVVRDSNRLESAARTASPLIVAVDVVDRDVYESERFGPISFVITTADTAASIAQAAVSARQYGAITASLYTTDPSCRAAAADAFAHAGVALSVNLTGSIFVNQSSAFSDFHVSGGNPAGNACLTDQAFVAGRFRIVCVRQPVAA